MFTNRKFTFILSSLTLIFSLTLSVFQPVSAQAEIPQGTTIPADTAPTNAPSLNGEIVPLVVTTWYVATTGNDLNSCTTTGSPCLTINGAIGKAATSGDTINIASGTYSGTGTEVVLINKSITLFGGWNAGFTTQSGQSTINGQNARRGITVSDSVIATIQKFIVQNGSSDLGGGIMNFGTLTLDSSVVTGNTALYGGGGISNNDASFDGSRLLVLNNSIISNNSASHFGSSGGGIRNGYNSTVILNNSTVSGNTVALGGCGGDGAGGGIFVADSNTSIATLNNSTVSGNQACNTGGGIYSRGVLSLNNSTISNNTAPGQGGGIRNGDGGIAITLQNSIISGNTVSDCSGLITSLGYNLIGNNTGCTITPTDGDLIGTPATPINATLTPLQDNGGPTFTHALMSDSPAIDAGNPASPGSGGNACLSTDQRGASRLQGNACDMGAFESAFSVNFINITGNADVVGVTLSFTELTSRVATTDGSGNYSLSVRPGWSGIITPSRSGYVFSPVNRIYNNLAANQTAQDYTAIPQNFITGNVGVAGTTLSYMDGTSKQVAADGSGNYSISISPGWSGTITPFKSGYAFTPSTRSYVNVVADQINQNYTPINLAVLIQDPSFEFYTPNPYWSETSTNFGTPLCSLADCGTGGGSAMPRTGSIWGWFGGVPTNETASISQTVTFPNGVPNLKLQFYFWIGAVGPGSDASDVFTVRVDGVTVFSANATQQALYPTYTLVMADVSAFADGASHTITFSSVTTNQLVTFNLDDVALTNSIFFDVPSDYGVLQFIERLYNAGITGGCSVVPLMYCPDFTVSRAQMAVFLLRGIHGSGYVPPAVGVGTGFADVPANHPVAAWIKQLSVEGITGGCGGGNYCPDATVTRAQMAIFLLRAKYTSAYTPPPANGDFSDVPVSHTAAAWIEQLSLEGITGGCGAGVYCPDANVTRAQMAVFLVRTFNLP